LHLEYETLLLPDGLDRSLVVDVAQHGSPTAEWLVMLASWSGESLASPLA
jgi:hypothetical protein